ncbi:MAG: hypothetical protein D6B25_17980 [Desulfobulbaceae bacterium]|nr:MAG: hypothetical protein D6B25_17980 [Desulfobulbaceae bacterium]
MKRLFTQTYDIAGNSFLRVVKLCALNKVLPIGNFKHGIGMRPAVVLLLLHYLGKPLFRVTIKYEQQLHRIYQRLKKRSS